MTDHEKTSRDYLEAWRTSQAEMQQLRDALDVERERVRVLREALEFCDSERSMIEITAQMIARKAKEALATTEPEDGA